MTEQKLEALMIGHLQTATSGLENVSLQFLGTWQPATDAKAFEDSGADGFVSVKCLPRTYDTPTIPDGSCQIIVSLTMRADVDAGGQDYLAVTDAISACLQRWQKSYAAYAEDFAVANEFAPTGYNIESGDCGLDADKCIWTYSAIVNLYGIIS